MGLWYGCAVVVVDGSLESVVQAEDGTSASERFKLRCRITFAAEKVCQESSWNTTASQPLPRSLWR